MVDVEAAIQAGQRWAEYREDLEQTYELRLRVEDAVHQPELIRRAVELLESDVPLALHFPDGKRAIPPFTPRQVLLLADRLYRRVTHEETMYQTILTEIRSKLGRQESRRCWSATQSGNECNSWSLPYIEDKRRCWNHSSAEARKHNDEMVQREERMLHAALEKLG